MKKSNLAFANHETTTYAIETSIHVVMLIFIGILLLYFKEKSCCGKEIIFRYLILT